MSSAKSVALAHRLGYATYIGRVGALAVALAWLGYGSEGPGGSYVA